MPHKKPSAGVERKPHAKPPAGVRLMTTDEAVKRTHLSDRRLRQLAQEGYFPPPASGKYQTDQTLDGLIRYYREQAEKKDASTEDLKRERLRKQVSILDKQDQKQELELLQTKGEYLSIKQIAEAVRGLCEQAKSEIQFKLIDQLPQLNAGLGVVEQRQNARRVFEEVLKKLQKFGDDYEH